ncbi:FAD-binding domain-containing protein 18 [Elsinoe fawcettii]|nr:FAD-binding domain-containing protein 18 [Elsinoe fawcettii]
MTDSPPSSCDVLVVGGGNAGFCAAISAAENGAQKVIIIDKCPEEWSGGNSFFTAGAMRTVHGGLPDLLPVVNNVDKELADRIDLAPYTTSDFRGDMDRICQGKSDPTLSSILINESIGTIKWLAQLGVRFQLSFNRQAFLVDNRYKFWGGLALKTQDGGKGLIEDHKAAAQRLGIKVYYSTSATALHTSAAGAVTSVSVNCRGRSSTISTRATILAAGGFEANPSLRAKHLGRGWDLAYVRGTPHNTGDLLDIAVRDVQAKTAGDWSGCHATCWDANAPRNSGDRGVSNEFTKSGYPLGVMVNTAGERFVDEGIDFRNYTYAIFGRQILTQPGGTAFQVWDSRTIPWLRDEEYRDEVVNKITADSIEDLADKCAQVGLEGKVKFVETMKEYNSAVHDRIEEQPERKWDPAIKDGMSTQSSKKSLQLAKSNWALPIDKPPFLAVKVTGGITFTFGGLEVNPQTTAVKSETGREVPGLFCVGEMLGGLFYNNYPGGSGLTSGAVFGRRAGRAAAQAALTSTSQPRL